MTGAVLTGIFHQGFISKLDGGSSDGGAIEGNGILVGYQIAAAVSIAAYSFIVTYLILVVMSLVPGITFKATDQHEDIGFDLGMRCMRANWTN
jgi:Amt family ammonium transporter